MTAELSAMPPSPTDSGASPVTPLLYKVSEVLAMLRMGRTQFYAQVSAGRLATVKQGTSTRVTADDLAAYVALLKREAAEGGQ